MLQATSTYTPPPLGAATHIVIGMTTALPASRLQYAQDAVLTDACQATSVGLRAVDALSAAIADLRPDDPVHEAGDRAIARLQPVWRLELERAVRTPASGVDGLLQKAGLLASLIERQGVPSVEASPSLALAASMAADILLDPWRC